MGLKDIADRYRKHDIKDRIDNLEILFEGKRLSRKELLDLKAEIKNRLGEVTGLLDRKLIDIQTLFEISRELNSTLSVSDLLEIISFTLMGQFQLSDCAIFFIHGNTVTLANQKGFPSLVPPSCSEAFISWLAERNGVVSVNEITGFKGEYQAFEQSGIRLIAPMIGKNGLSGIIALSGKPDAQHYSAEEKNLVHTLASLSAISLENARLYEELKTAWQNLDRKVGEFSTLYEISRVINSSEEFELVLSLITETITTGFGVRSAIIFLNDSGRNTIRKVIGLPKELTGTEVKLAVGEEKLAADNRVDVLPVNPGLKDWVKPFEKNLFVPLMSANRRIGGIVIYSFENYEINSKNQDLINLFSIIASQAAPPILMTGHLSREKDNTRDLLDPLIAAVRQEIDRAGNFGVGVTLCMVKMNGFKKYCGFYGVSKGLEKAAGLVDRIREAAPATSTIIRYCSDRILVIMPALSASGFDEIREKLLSSAGALFSSDREADIGLDLLSARYPEDGEDPASLLILVE